MEQAQGIIEPIGGIKDNVVVRVVKKAFPFRHQSFFFMQKIIFVAP